MSVEILNISKSIFLYDKFSYATSKASGSGEDQTNFQGGGHSFFWAPLPLVTMGPLIDHGAPDRSWGLPP